MKYAKLFGKVFVGSFAIGLGAGIIFKGSVVGLVVAGVGGFLWGAYCANEFLKQETIEYTNETVRQMFDKDILRVVPGNGGRLNTDPVFN